MMEWQDQDPGLDPGDVLFVPCGNDDCTLGVVGVCLYCEQRWYRCECGAMNSDCECGKCAERSDEYATHRMVSLEMAILRHRKETGDNVREQDQALYSILDDV